MQYPRELAESTQGELQIKHLICLTVEILERGTSLRARITAPTISRALEIAGDGKPERRVRVVFPTEPEGFFVIDSGTTLETHEPAKAA
jgi:hypothetical protein